jgi:hypothetical protein
MEEPESVGSCGWNMENQKSETLPANLGHVHGDDGGFVQKA